MPIRLFELLCLATVALTLVVMARGRSTSALFRTYAALALAGLMGEESMILLYRFYAYAPAWDAHVGDVPIVVPLIWPLVVLSARDVVRALAERPTMLRSVVVRSLAIGAFVSFDASLVEVVAVRAGLWTWTEPGHLGVPIIGILGWGFFAFGASLPLLAAEDRNADAPAWALVSCVVLGPLVAHALVEIAWWTFFRSHCRGDLASSPLAILAFGALPLAIAVTIRLRGLSIPMSVAAPRIVAAGLFLALLVTSAGADPALLASTVIVALPYTCLTRFGAGRERQHPREEFC